MTFLLEISRFLFVSGGRGRDHAVQQNLLIAPVIAFDTTAGIEHNHAA